MVFSKDVRPDQPGNQQTSHAAYQAAAVYASLPRGTDHKKAAPALIGPAAAG